MASNRLLVMCRTYGGAVARVAILVGAAIVDPSGATVAAIRAAIDAISTTKQEKASITQPGNYSTTSAAGAYEDDQDKATMTFLDSAGKYHTYRVPAPKEAIFLADRETVDLTNVSVVAFAAYVTANFVSKTGATLVSLVGGRRIRLNAGRAS